MSSPLDRLTAALSRSYRLERELGRGGMATVFLAQDIRHERQVAIKVLHEDLSASLGKERFLREIRIAAGLQHPHILPLYDSGEADGLLYYVMPYVEGQTLRERLVREGELPVADAVRILRDIADALAEAHRAGVVHRDLKPENVMLRGRHALVADFGVAKALSEATGRQELTTVGVALGTPTYMAPEQATADPHLDHRADLYAFGVVAYELLTGRPPFTGNNAQQVLAAHITSAAPPITDHRALTPALAGMVMQCLEKKPADRCQSAEELIPLLESVLTPSGGITPSATVPISALPGPRRRLVPALGAVGALALAALAFVLTRGPAEGARGAAAGGRIAVFPFDARSADSTDLWLAEGLSEQIGSRLARVPELQVLSATSVSAQLGRTPDPLEAAQALTARWVVTGQLRRAGNEVQVRTEVAVASNGVQLWSATLRRSDGDFQLLEAAVAESVLVVLMGRGTNPLAVATGRAEAVEPEAYRLYLLANAQLNRRTQETVAQAIQHYQEALRRDSGFAAAWAELGSARMIQSSWRWETEVPRDSLPALARQGASRALALDSTLARGWSVLGQAASWADGDFTVAIPAFERAIALDSMDANIWHFFGTSLGADLANDLPRAEQYLRRALQLDPNLPNTWRHLGRVVAWQGRLAEGEAIMDTVLALGPWAPGHDSRAEIRFLRGNGAGALDDQRTADRLAGGVLDSFRLALYPIAMGDSQPARQWLAALPQGMGPMELMDQAMVSGNELAPAVMLVALGRRALALDFIERLTPSAGAKAFIWGGLRSPHFAALRGDPRFARVLDRLRPPGAK